KNKISKVEFINRNYLSTGVNLSKKIKKNTYFIV
ncbi:hypothetical protein, partial [uncultured Gammaproteobacteria bacterium]